MPYFHVTAVFEARGSSLEDADRAAAAVLKNIRHPRVLYYEHETNEGIASSASAGVHYFTVIADLDVEASTEENGADIVEEVLDTLSTDAVQYLAHGIIPGDRRVPFEQRPPLRAEQAPEQSAEEEQEERGGRGGRKRGPRGRGRKRGGTLETERDREDTDISAPVSVSPERLSDTQMQAEPVAPPVVLAPPTLVEPAPSMSVPVTISLTPVEVEPSPPPPRSSAAMHVTLTVTLRASELELPANGAISSDQQELIRVATAEARRRHPELPDDVTPICEVVTLPWGDTVLTLTWHYDVRVPSAADAE